MLFISNVGSRSWRSAKALAALGKTPLDVLPLEPFDRLFRFHCMKQLIWTTTLPLAAIALIMTASAVSQAPEGDTLAQNRGQTIVYKDPDGAWPGTPNPAGPNRYTQYDPAVPLPSSTSGYWI